MEVPKVYKALVEKDGKLESLVIGRTGWRNYPTLFYEEGQVTYAPKGSMGIYVDDMLEESIRSATLNPVKAREIGGITVVHEAIPLGENMRCGSAVGGFSVFHRYPAILLGKEVWQEEQPKPPEPEWKDVTEECVAIVAMTTDGGLASRCVRVYHGIKLVASFGGKGIADGSASPPRGYQVEFHEGEYQGGFNVFKKMH